MADWNDSNVMSKRANLLVRIANKYRKVRKECAGAKELLDLKLALAYRNKNIPKKLAYEKAIIMLIEESKGTPEEDLIANTYSTFINSQAEYKGLEKVLEAHQGRMILCQSLIKNQLRST